MGIMLIIELSIDIFREMMYYIACSREQGNVLM